MTSIGQPDQQRYQPCINAMPPRASLLSYGSRVLLLAVGGFLIVRIALALLHLT
jgi:hypothetical protein